MSFYSIDIEADGPAPGLYSMSSIGIVRVTDPIVDSLYLELAPISDDFIPAAAAVSGLDRTELIANGTAPAEAMRLIREFVDTTSRGRPILIADNPGFDAGFLNYYCWAFPDGLEQPNPFGHSSRRIGDLWAGMQGDAKLSSHWKSLRTTGHTHNALDDAMGNAEALLEMKRRGLRIGFK